MYLVNMSIDNYLVIEETTKQIVNLHKNAVGSSRWHNPDTHELLEEIQKKSLVDFWRGLRTHQATNAMKTKNPNVENIPNNTYPYYLVKKTIDQVYPNIKVRSSRFWNETLAKDIADEVLYSLSEYWPGMPIDADYHLRQWRIRPPSLQKSGSKSTQPTQQTTRRQLTLLRQSNH
jgi:hypothetical protein